MSNMVLVLDMGDGRGANVARRVRSEQVYCEVLPADATIDQIKKGAPMGVLIAGDGADDIACLDDLIDLGVPVLAMGSSARLLLRRMGGEAAPTPLENSIAQVSFEPGQLFDGLGDSERFFERLDDLTLPEGVRAIATTAEGCVAAFEARDRIFGMQFYAEQNDPDGFQILRNFARGVCQCEPLWRFDRFVEETIREVQEKAQGGRVLLAVSGGVDSVVCAALIYKALGDRLVCAHVDTGLTRKGELELTRRCLEPQGMRLRVIDARDRFIERLSGVSSTQRKTELVDREMLLVLEEEARALDISCLGLGVTYTDVLEGGAPDRALSPNSPFRTLIEPARRLFKEEVRQAADSLNLPPELNQRPSFPTAGLAVRLTGMATPEKLAMLREADAIYCEEIQKAGLDKRIRQYFAVLTEIKTIGADGRRAGYTLALRAMNGANVFRLPYDLLERVAERVTGEVGGVNRVVYDVTGHPPSQVEWESD